MYLWLVLSTFLAILAGYSLPVRMDIEEKKDLPVASAYLHRMIVNHKTAMEYVKKNKWPYYCGGIVPGDGEILTSCSEVDKIGYTPGVISADDIVGYELVDFVFDENNYISEIFCSNEDGTESDNCINESGNVKKRYLVTYGDLYDGWIMHKELDVTPVAGTRQKVTPRDEILKVMGDIFPLDATVGYVMEDSGNAYILNSRGQSVFTFPAWMWNAVYGSDMCNKRFNGSCIAYLSLI